MSSETKIQWTDHTFNPWWGCTKVHDGCKNCYAEAFDKRVGGAHWGTRASRRMILGEWGNPAKWNKVAAASGVRARVFCASMCDLFEELDRGLRLTNRKKLAEWVRRLGMARKPRATFKRRGK